jgi:DNA-binding SARP family transcriptional activator/WD40 repeat protein
MRIAVLGPLEVSSDDGFPVAVPGAKERLLLAVLAAGAPGVVSVDRLAEALWNGDPPVSARKSLQAHVVRLRSALEPDRPRGSSGRYVVRRGPGYALTVDRASIDALHISDLAARGQAELASGHADEAVRQLDVAVDLWRGEPYCDWPEASFASGERCRLDQLRAAAVAGLLEARLQLGGHAEVLPELERLVAEDPLREDWWRLLMLALYRGGRQADALAAGRRVRAVLADEVGAAPGPALQAMEAAILAQDPQLELPSGRSPPPMVHDGHPGATAATCPYKGLAAYQTVDAPLFHGRQRLVAGLVARLVDVPLLVVSGPSGAGKSSVVRAGLLPALAGGALPGSGAWVPVIVTPGRRPVDVLASLTGESPPAAPVVLVCDQVEELWCTGVDPAERTAFLDAVLGLMDDGIVVRCVAVVRGDHVGRLAEHTAFTERLGAAILLVPALTDPELREIVREPARTVGLFVDPELLDAVVADVLGEVGALPLLSTALVGTWERRRGERLTLAGYLEAGGVAGALVRSAEAIYAALDEAGQESARRLLVRLADVDEGGALVRRPVSLAELDLDGEGGVAWRDVVDAFVGRRLLTVDGERVEVTHEALLTGWPRLARWLEDDAAGRAMRRHLDPAARDWEAGGRADDELYRGARLAAALDWAEDRAADVTPVEHRFLEASRKRAEAELTNARARVRRTRRLATGLTALLVVALVATFLAVRAQRDAEHASVIADANRLAALSTTAGTLDVALLLAAQAVRLAGTPETEDALLAALAEHGRAERTIPFDGDPYRAMPADGGRVVFLDSGDEVRAWQVGPSSETTVVAPVPFPEWDGWNVVAPSPSDDVLMGAGASDGRAWVATISADGSTRLVAEGPDIGGTPLTGAGAFSADGRRVYLLVTVPDAGLPDGVTRWGITEIDVVDGAARQTGIGGIFPGPVDSMTADFSDDGGAAALGDNSGGGPLTLIDVDAGRTTVAQTPDRRADREGFRSLSSGAALLWDDGAVTLLDGNGAAVQQLEVHQEPVSDVVVSPDGTWASTAGKGGTVLLWDIDPGSGRWSQRETLTGHDGDVVDLAVDPAGRRLFTMSRDHTLVTWDMTADGGFGTAFPALHERWIANVPQLIESTGLLVVPTRPGTSGWPDIPGPGTATVAATFLDPATGDVVSEVDVGDTLAGVPFGSSVAVSPDGGKVAVTSGLGTTVLDTGSRAVIAEIELPANGSVDDAGEPLPATPVWCAAWTPDGDGLLLCADELGAEGSTGGHLARVDTATWEVDPHPVETGGSAQSIDVSPDDEVVAVASGSSSEIVILGATDLETQRRLAVADGDRVHDVSFSPDGRWLAGTGRAGLLYVFDTTTWEPAWAPVPVHDGWALQTEWLADGRTVATTGTDGTVALVDVERGLVRARPLPASGEGGAGYTHLVPGPTDELVVLGGDRSGRRYPTEPSAWLDQACTIVGRDLTSGEWDRYLPGRPYEETCTDLS